jgi:hypothetical protein
MTFCQCSTANDVQLADSAIPENLTLIEGTLEASLGKIDVGSTATHSYVVKADKGSFVAEFKPALVTYKPEFDSNEEQVSCSSYAVHQPSQAFYRHVLCPF